MSSSVSPLEELHSFLFSILTTINYTDDKEAFIAHFFDICFAKSVMILTDNNTKENKNDILITITTLKNPQLVSEFLGNHFGDAPYSSALKKGIEDTFADFFSFLSPQLTKQEKERIADSMHQLLGSGSFVHR